MEHTSPFTRSLSRVVVREDSDLSPDGREGAAAGVTVEAGVVARGGGAGGAPPV